jgi:hypothetical protein
VHGSWSRYQSAASKSAGAASLIGTSGASPLSLSCSRPRPTGQVTTGNLFLISCRAAWIAIDESPQYDLLEFDAEVLTRDDISLPAPQRG